MTYRSLKSRIILSLLTLSFLEMTFLRWSTVWWSSTLISKLLPVVVLIARLIVCAGFEPLPRPDKFWWLELCWDIFDDAPLWLLLLLFLRVCLLPVVVGDRRTQLRTQTHTRTEMYGSNRAFVKAHSRFFSIFPNWWMRASLFTFFYATLSTLFFCKTLANFEFFSLYIFTFHSHLFTFLHFLICAPEQGEEKN